MTRFCSGIEGERTRTARALALPRHRPPARPTARRRLGHRGERSDSSGIRARSLTILVPGAAAGTAVVVLAFSSGGYFASDHGLLLLAFALVALTSVLVLDEARVDRRSLLFVAGLAGLALWALGSALWAHAAAWPVLEAERGLVYAVAVTALLLVTTPRRMTSLLAGVAAAATAVAVFALSTRLLPGGRGGAYDPVSGYRLAEPIGYSNALGLLLAIGLLLALGVALRPEPALRVIAGGALVPLAVALYFTFSRGSIGAFALGLLVLSVLERGGARWRVAVLSAVPAASVLLASRSPALTSAGHPLEAAQVQGGRLTWILAALAGVGAAVAWVLPRATARLRVASPGRRGGLAAAAAAAAACAFVAVSLAVGPVAIARSAVDAFRDEPGETSGDLDRRLLSVSGNWRADYWRVATRMVRREPLLGEGAGTFERWWMQERPAAHDVRDAHNLYLETLAELGLVGLVLLLVALIAPLTAIRRARGSPLGAAAAAAYVAFLAHAALDWDWEVPLLVLSALVCGAALLVAGVDARPVSLTPARRSAGIAAAVVVLGIALVAHVGNRATVASASALERGDVEAAETAARRARAWAPWSHDPWRMLGEAELAVGNLPAARRALDEARRRAEEEWRVWLDLALASREPETGYAITRARELNPLGPEILALGHR